MSANKENAVEQFLDSMVQATKDAKLVTEYPVPSKPSLQDFLLDLMASSPEEVAKRDALISDLEKLTGKPLPRVALSGVVFVGYRHGH